MFTAFCSRISQVVIKMCSRTEGTRQSRLLHSLTVKLTETFPALRQAAGEREGRNDLAGCLTQRMDDEQHVDHTAPPLIHVWKHTQHWEGGDTGRHMRYWSPSSPTGHLNTRVLVDEELPWLYTRCCRSCVRTGAGHTLRLIHSAMTRGHGAEHRPHPPRGRPLSPAISNTHLGDSPRWFVRSDRFRIKLKPATRWHMGIERDPDGHHEGKTWN